MKKQSKKESTKDFLKKYNCSVRLERMNFSKIRIGCSANTTEPGVNLACSLKQTGTNTFFLQIKRKGDDLTTLNQPKTLKFNTAQTNGLSTPETHVLNETPSIASRLRVKRVAESVPSKPKGRVEKKAKKLVSARPKNKIKPCESVSDGQIVLCKMRGYSEWPAIVTGISGNVIAVEFFGDHTIQNTTIKNIFPIENAAELMLSHLKTHKTPLYSKSVQEAEKALGIPQELSILRRI